MKRLLYIVSLILVANLLMAQTDDDALYVDYESMPAFLGGQDSLFRYLSQNIRYPEVSKTQKEEGRAIVQFVITKTGAVDSVKVVKSSGYTALDAEALRVVESMPKWIPGKKFGKAVNMKYTIPVNFKLPENKPAEEKRVFTKLERQPEFPGGKEALLKFLKDNVQYPKDAQRNSEEGRSVVSFIVNKDGSISDVKVVKSSGSPSLDEEAVRVLSSMPDWKPGLQEGRPVKTKYTVPVTFSL